MKYFWFALGTALVILMAGAAAVFGGLNREVAWYLAHVGMPVGILAFLVFSVLYMVTGHEE